MKELLIDKIFKKKEFSYFLTGRCCQDDILIGNVLKHLKSDIEFVVKDIQLYGKSYEFLAHGYHGTIVVDSTAELTDDLIRNLSGEIIESP